MGSQRFFLVISVLFSGCTYSAMADEGVIEPLIFQEIGTVGNKTFFAELLTVTSWAEAHKTCLGHGMFLASVMTQDEKQLILDYFTSVGMPDGSDFWLSGTDFGSAGSYYWLDNGLSINEPSVSGSGVCEDSSFGAGICTCHCSCAGMCSCSGVCSGNCVNFRHTTGSSNVIRVAECDEQLKLICQRINRK